MEPTNWAPEHSDALREHLAKGLSFAKAAEAINSQFKTAYTRNAALGRAKRMGLLGQDRVELSLAVLSSKPQATGEARPVEPRWPAFHWPTPVFERTKPRKLRCAAVEPRHLALTELEHGDCRYPYGGDGEREAITFCGHPRRAGSSYCSPHFDLSRNPVMPENSAAVDAWLQFLVTA
jgi:GcrA cell cycle regulator